MRIFSPFGDEGRNLHHQSGFHLRRLGHVGHRGALEPGFGFHHGHIHGGRQFHSDGLAFVELHFYLQLRDQILRGIAQQIFHQVHLLVGFGVHEIVILAIVVQVLHLLLVEHRLFDLVFGREAVFRHAAGSQAAHFGLYETAQVAGRPVRHAEDCVQFVVVLDHHSRTQLCR